MLNPRNSNLVTLIGIEQSIRSKLERKDVKHFSVCFKVQKMVKSIQCAKCSKIFFKVSDKIDRKQKIQKCSFEEELKSLYAICSIFCLFRNQGTMLQNVLVIFSVFESPGVQVAWPKLQQEGALSSTYYIKGNCVYDWVFPKGGVIFLDPKSWPRQTMSFWSRGPTFSRKVCKTEVVAGPK